MVIEYLNTVGFDVFILDVPKGSYILIWIIICSVNICLFYYYYHPGTYNYIKQI